MFVQRVTFGMYMYLSIILIQINLFEIHVMTAILNCNHTSYHVSNNQNDTNVEFPNVDHVNETESQKTEEILSNQEQMILPKYSGGEGGRFDDMITFRTEHNLTPFMNRWMRNNVAARGIQMLLRAIPKPDITRPFRSFRYPHMVAQEPEDESIYDHGHLEQYNLHRMLRKPIRQSDYGSLSSPSSYPIDYGEQSPISAYVGTKDVPNLEIPAETDIVDTPSSPIDTLFDTYLSSDIDTLNKPIKTPIQFDGSISHMLNPKSMYPFVTYDLDTIKFAYPNRKHKSNRKIKKRKIKSMQSIAIKDKNSGNFQSSSEPMESSSVDEPSETINKHSKHSNVFKFKDKQTGKIIVINDDLLLNFLESKLNSEEFLNLILKKLIQNSNSQTILPNVTPPQLESNNYMIKKIKPNVIKNRLLQNQERSVSNLEHFNYDKDYSYFETPKCANSLNSTFCLQDDNYPSDLIREDIQLNRNQIRSFFDIWLQKSEYSIAHHHLVDHLNDREDERYDWNHYFSIDKDPDDSTSAHSNKSGPSFFNDDDHFEFERNKIRLKSDYFRRGGYICSSIVTYSNLKRAKNLDKQWKFVINLDDKLLGQNFRQTVRLEQCIYPDVSCNYLSSSFNSHCIQKYNYQQLLSWTRELGIHLDVYRLPIACSCHFRKSLDFKP